jgi:hypothetical protein
MDYRYYYETIETARTERPRRVGLRTVVAAGLAVEAAAAALPGLGTSPTLALACAAAAVTALVLRQPLGRALSRAAGGPRTAGAAPAF